jgi:hypothetical protein
LTTEDLALELLAPAVEGAEVLIDVLLLLSWRSTYYTGGSSTILTR